MAVNYEIKGIKNFKGHEGEPLAQGNLYRDGKKVAEWSDDSTGGEMHYRFVSPAESTAFVSFAKQYLDGKNDILDRPYEVAKMDEYALIPEALGKMALLAIEEAELRKLCSKGLAFSLKGKDGKPTDETMTYKLLFTEGEVKYLQAKFPELGECLNARFGNPMKDGSPEHLAAEKAFYQKDCKTKILFVVIENGRRVVYTVKQPFTSTIAPKLRAKYPNLVRILNEE